jgi:hypothetical protein
LQALRKARSRLEPEWPPPEDELRGVLVVTKAPVPSDVVFQCRPRVSGLRIRGAPEAEAAADVLVARERIPETRKVSQSRISPLENGL